MRLRTLTTVILTLPIVLGAADRLGAEQPGGLFVPPPATGGVPPHLLDPKPRRLPPVEVLREGDTPAWQGQQIQGFGAGGIRSGNQQSGVPVGGPQAGMQLVPPVEVPAAQIGEPPEREIPAGFTPWWQAAALRPLRPSPTDVSIDINSLIVDTLRYSSQVRAISDNAVIAESSIVRAAAEFDVHAFMDSKYVRTSLPTGSTLEAGPNVPRLRERDWYYKAGMRKKNHYGGEFELAQQIGLRNSNSQFFLPDNQGNSRLTLSYNQPLLNGAGRAYNNSLTLLAEIDTKVASFTTATELQDHLLSVTEAMWELYQQRTVLLQKQRHLERAQVILERLDHRRGVDSLESQIARARAAVSMRRAEIIRAGTSVKNAEARLRALVNSPTMLSCRDAELTPIEPPTGVFIPVNMGDAVVTALENRPEINAATAEIKAASVRLNVAKNELMPVLDLVVETYVSGLRGNHSIQGSLVDQMSVGEPSHTAGLVFEVPIHRRAAKANYQRRRVEMRQLSNRLQAAIETLHADVEVAVREVETTYRELQAKFVSMAAADIDVRYLQRRWEELPGDDRAASFLLEDLLDAQDRLALEEFGFARAQVDYTMSLTRLNRATGTLLRFEQIELIRTDENCLPTIMFEKRHVLDQSDVPLQENSVVAEEVAPFDR